MGVRVMVLKEIEESIVQLPVTDLDKLVHWLDDYRAQLWDRQLEEDLAAGRLEALVAEVNEEYEAGLSQPLRNTGPWPTSGTTSDQFLKLFPG